MSQPPPTPPEYGDPPAPRGVGGGTVFVIAALLFLLGLSIGGVGGYFVGSVHSFMNELGDGYADGNVLLTVTSPAEVRVGDEFEIVVELTNVGDQDVFIATIDLWAGYLDGIEILGSDPAWTRRASDVEDSYDELYYNLNIPAGGSAEVKLRARAKQAGTWADDLDVYFESDWSMLTHSQKTTVVDASIDDTP